MIGGVLIDRLLAGLYNIAVEFFCFLEGNQPILQLPIVDLLEDIVLEVGLHQDNSNNYNPNRQGNKYIGNEDKYWLDNQSVKTYVIESMLPEVERPTPTDCSRGFPVLKYCLALSVAIRSSLQVRETCPADIPVRQPLLDRYWSTLEGDPEFIQAWMAAESWGFYLRLVATGFQALISPMIMDCSPLNSEAPNGLSFRFRTENINVRQYCLLELSTIPIPTFVQTGFTVFLKCPGEFFKFMWAYCRVLAMARFSASMVPPNPLLSALSSALSPLGLTCQKKLRSTISWEWAWATLERASSNSKGPALFWARSWLVKQSKQLFMSSKEPDLGGSEVTILERGLVEVGVLLVWAVWIEAVVAKVGEAAWSRVFGKAGTEGCAGAGGWAGAGAGAGVVESGRTTKTEPNWTSLSGLVSSVVLKVLGSQTTSGLQASTLVVGGNSSILRRITLLLEELRRTEEADGRMAARRKSSAAIFMSYVINKTIINDYNCATCQNQKMGESGSELGGHFG